MTKNLYVSDFVRGIFCSLLYNNYIKYGDVLDWKKVHKAFEDSFNELKIAVDYDYLCTKPVIFDLNLLFRIKLNYGESDHVYEQIIVDMTRSGLIELRYSGKYTRAISNDSKLWNYVRKHLGDYEFYNLLADIWWNSYRGIISDDETRIQDF